VEEAEEANEVKNNGIQQPFENVISSLIQDTFCRIGEQYVAARAMASCAPAAAICTQTLI
jgi:hypothetical protein